jgi:D-xylose 1-dehydrogenase (NADP+, D-xylono-1,5-lactone-forming)
MAGAENTNGEAVRWGVLGTAKIGLNATIPGIQKSRNGRLAAIASRDIARAEAVAAREPGAKVYGSYEALLDDPEIEAVYIPLPNALHVEWTIRAAEHGKHVLCEKPLAPTAAEVRRMIDACTAAGVLLMEAFMYRFHPQTLWALELLRQGRIGQVQLVRSAFHFDISARPRDIRLQAALAGGSLMDIGCYPLNFSRAVFGGAPRGAAAHTVIMPGAEVETKVGAVLDFGDGRMSMIDSSFQLPRQFFAEVWGERGRLLLPSPFTPGIAETVVRIEVDDEVTERHFAPVDQYQLEAEHFAECIRNGQPVALPPADALEQAEAIEMIYRAAGYTWPR